MSEEIEQAKSEPAEGAGPAELWRRIREHKIVQWAVAYVAIGYGIQHAVVLTSELLDLPHAVERLTMILLVLGLPVVLTLAWYQGARASRRVSTGEFSILSVLLVLGAFLIYVFERPAEQVTVRQVVVTKVASATPTAPKPAADSVAVLPFLNLSGDPKEEYFSDGMTEEITSALANVSGLAVVARTSAFAFKDKNEDVRVIGKELGANYVIEGSVRKAGNEVRITAQLINSATGNHLWTDSYDRDLKDIFAVQEDVAKAIAAALQVPLGLKEGETLVSNRSIDVESYENYLRAQALFRTRVQFTAAIALLEQVVARQPDYSPAWALLSQVYALAPNYDPVFQWGSVAEVRRVVAADFPKAEAAARRAIQLDPRNADAYATLGEIQEDRGKLLDADQYFQQALAFDPLNPNTLHWYSLVLATSGRIKEAAAMGEQLRSVDPLVPIFNTFTAQILLVAGNKSQALAIVQALPANTTARIPTLMSIYAAMGRYKDAADLLSNLLRRRTPPEAVEATVRLLRMAPAQAPRQGIPYLGSFSFVFAYVGLPERVFEENERDADSGYGAAGTFTPLWQPEFRAARQTERFKTLVRKLGLVDYWRAKGWPQFCHPTTNDDFACN